AAFRSATPASYARCDARGPRGRRTSNPRRPDRDERPRRSASSEAWRRPHDHGGRRCPRDRSRGLLVWGDPYRAGRPAGNASEPGVAARPRPLAARGSAELYPGMPLQLPAGFRDPDDQLRRHAASTEERRNDERLRKAGGARPQAAGGDLHEPCRARRLATIILDVPTTD